MLNSEPTINSGSHFDIYDKNIFRRERLQFPTNSFLDRLKPSNEILKEISESLRKNLPTIRLEGFFKLTKTEKSYCNALLKRDFLTEENVNFLVENRSDWQTLLARYERLNDYDIQLKKPKHYAATILHGSGSMVSGKNIFLSFPECLNLKWCPSPFGIEFIDIWVNLFTHSVFPSARSVFTNESSSQLIPNLNEQLKETVYLASIFHELGHQVGPFRVSPTKSSNNKLSSFYLDIFGELSTDALLAHKLPEFPTLAAFILLQRLFWFPRRGFMDNPLAAKINVDNDSWIGAYLWNELLRKQILIKVGNKWEVRHTLLADFFKNIDLELDKIGKEIFKLGDSDSQDKFALDWMKSKVEYDSELGFLFHPEQRNAFLTCARHPEIPHFQPLLDSASF